MIPQAPSFYSLIAAGLYLGVAGACLLALTTAISRQQARWHIFGWLALGALFLMLALARAYVFEDVLRESLRSLLRFEGAYEQRREIQGPVFATLFIGAAAVAGFWFYRVTQTISGRRNVAAVLANAAGGAMILLFSLRIVSLHSVDQLLYGPLKLNWIIDICLSVLVLACGAYYWAVVTGRAR